MPIDGSTTPAEFSEENADAIISHFKQNERTPIDCNPMLFLLSERTGRTEAERAAVRGEGLAGARELPCLRCGLTLREMDAALDKALHALGADGLMRTCACPYL